MAGRSTLIKAPELDPSKAQIENALELTDLSIIGPVWKLPIVFLAGPLNISDYIMFANSLNS